MKKILFSIMCCLLLVGLTTGCNKKQEVSELTKDEIKEIEKMYLNSDNILNIENNSTISDRGTVVTGAVQSGIFNENDIVEYINVHGDLKKSTVKSIEKFASSDNFISVNENGGMLLQGVDSDDIKLSSIVFKQSDFNGISINFINNKENINKIKDIVTSNDDFEIKINDENVTTHLVSFYADYINESYNTINISLIINNNNTYEVGSTVSIGTFTGTIDALLK